MSRKLKRALSTRELPEPQDQLPLGELFRFYHDKLNAQWRSECKIIVYRMDPALAPFPSMLKKDSLPHHEASLKHEVKQGLMPDLAWWEQSNMPKPWTATFCVRINRTWKTQYGSRKKEICVSSFEVTP